MKASVICAWCGKKMGDTENNMGRDSHSICIKCYEKTVEELRDIEKFKPMLEKGSNTVVKGTN